MPNMQTRYIFYAKALDCSKKLQVIQKTGLCICLYDILKASDGLIGHGTGTVNVNGWRCFVFDHFERQLLLITRSRISPSRLPAV